MARLLTAILAVALLPLSAAFADGDAEQQTTEVGDRCDRPGRVARRPR